MCQIKYIYVLFYFYRLFFYGWSLKEVKIKGQLQRFYNLWKSSENPTEWYMYNWNRPSSSRDIWVQSRISEKNSKN